MLRLERVQLAGFKSFCDRIDARLPHGIIGVVGPNGCGKSNLGDAINWVLGEQSAKNLRGKSMQDVIFAGSEKRKARGLAEVSLHFVDDRADADARRVVVTRRLFRSGESEYLIDGRKVRLKDIQELLRAERVGARTYATIEQGRIEQILNAKPKERRLIIEDAAGVSGFKHKRRLAELKLEATHANLLRVQDVEGEVRRRINSLKRQAAKARRYKALREELREIERVRFGARWRELARRFETCREAEAAARDAESQALAELAARESSLEAERERGDRLADALKASGDTLHRLDIEIDREERGIETCRERIADSERAVERCDVEARALDGRVDGLRRTLAEEDARVEAGTAELDGVRSRLEQRQGALDQATSTRSSARDALEALRSKLFGTMNVAAERRNRLRGLEDALERQVASRRRLETDRGAAHGDVERLDSTRRERRGELDRHLEALERLRERHASDETELAEARRELTSAREALATAKQEAHSLAERLRTLEDVAHRFAESSDGVRMLLSEGRGRGLKTLGVVADFVQAGSEVEGAAEAYLGAFLPAVILEDEQDARRAAEMLEESGAGRTTFLCRSLPAGGVAIGTPANGRGPAPADVMGDPRVRGRLRDGLTLNTAMNGVVQDRIGDAIVVDGLDAALELHRRYPSVDYLTTRGDVVYSSGVVAAGGRTGDRREGLLAHTRRIRETTEALERASTVVSAREAAFESKQSTVTRLEARVEELRAEVDRAAEKRVALQVELQRAEDEAARVTRRTEVLGAELDACVSEIARLEAASTEAREAVEQGEREHRDLEDAVREAGERLAEIERDLDAKAESVASARAELAARRESHEAAERERSRVRESVSELEDRAVAVREEREQARARGVEARERLGEVERELERHLAERHALVETYKRSESELAELRASIGRLEDEVRRHRGDVDVRRGAVAEAETARTRVESDRDHLDERCRSELGAAAAEVAEAASEAIDAVEADPESNLEQVEARVVEIREKIERIGPVNMMAIEEFAELEERHRFLETQREDLERSIESLKDTIRKVNRASRELFETAFEAIRKNFQEIFRVLFNGGRADLKLEEDADILEAGIEIVCQPPGKRFGGLQLLSGGEKAMSAIALLFAIFRHQPSPFCLLDEVDAALDDVNVGRFTRMLREYSSQTQFILVTHNKVSMDSADVLYGVTMEEPGVSRLVSLELH